jgi:aminotransferase
MNRNVQKIEISGIRKFYNKVAKVPDAISLTLGQPDFPVPLAIREAMIQAIRAGKTEYTPNSGIIELRKELCNYLYSMDIIYSPEEVCITAGGSEGLFSVFNALLNPGDKVIVPNPSYPAYASIVNLLGGVVVECGLNKDFTLNVPELKKIIEENKPKALVLSYPSNPTGAGMTKEMRDEIYKILKDREIIVITDEIYSALNFEDKYYSIAQYQDIRDKIILVSGFSKMFSMTGLRIGYVCAVKEYMDQILKIHQYNVSCAPSIVQWGAYEGLKNCLTEVKEMRLEFIERRNYVYSRLKSMGLEMELPRGAFYIFPSIENFNMSSEVFCERLLNEGKVAIVPGNAFGSKGEGKVRISYSYGIEELTIALDRMEKWIGKLKN